LVFIVRSILIAFGEIYKEILSLISSTFSIGDCLPPPSQSLQ
jgi:hypothetical protein